MYDTHVFVFALLLPRTTDRECVAVALLVLVLVLVLLLVRFLCPAECEKSVLGVGLFLDFLSPRKIHFYFFLPVENIPTVEKTKWNLSSLVTTRTYLVRTYVLLLPILLLIIE